MLHNICVDTICSPSPSSKVETSIIWEVSIGTWTASGTAQINKHCKHTSVDSSTLEQTERARGKSAIEASNRSLKTCSCCDVISTVAESMWVPENVSIVCTIITKRYHRSVLSPSLSVTMLAIRYSFTSNRLFSRSLGQLSAELLFSADQFVPLIPLSAFSLTNVVYTHSVIHSDIIVEKCYICIPMEIFPHQSVSYCDGTYILIYRSSPN